MKLFSFCLITFVSMTVMAQKRGAFTGRYPATKTTEQTDDFFGTKVRDPYRWLENDMSEDTKDWVQRQNRLTNAYLLKIPYRDAIRNRLTGIMGL
jgi:prolyl oligopeptidase